MGRHTGRPSGLVPEGPGAVLGWGSFATVIAAAALLGVGSGWFPALGVAFLGVVATAVLWWAGRRTAPPVPGSSAEVPQGPTLDTEPTA